MKPKQTLLHTLQHTLGLLTILALFAIPAQADFERTKIAVLDFGMIGDKLEPAGIGTILSEWFTTSIVKSGRFDVVERAMLQKIIAEQKLAASGMIDENTASELGKILGVKVIITGSILKLGDNIDINARIINVENGSIIAAESISSRADKDYHHLVEQLTEKIIQNFPLTGYIVKRNDNTAIIDLGLQSGLIVGTEFKVYKEGAVIKHPKTGEVLDVEQIQTGWLKITKVRRNVAIGTILSEEGDGIEYGQLVKSVQASDTAPQKKAQPAPQPSIVETPQEIVPPTPPEPAPAPKIVLKQEQSKKKYAPQPVTPEQPSTAYSSTGTQRDTAPAVTAAPQPASGPGNHVALFPIKFHMQADVIAGYMRSGLPDSLRQVLDKLDRSGRYSFTDLIRDKSLLSVAWDQFEPNLNRVVEEAQKSGFDYVLMYYASFWEGQGLVNGWGTDFFSPTFKVFLVDVHNRKVTEREDKETIMQDQLFLELKGLTRQLLEETTFPN